MKLLALDTATEACSVALWLDGELIVDALELAHGHAGRILPMIDALLSARGLKLADLDGIAAGRGPGGFTGVRLAISVAQGLAFGAVLPVVGISNLAAVAQAMLDRDASVSDVLVCNDARMHEVYTAHYRRAAAGDLAVLEGEERVAKPGTVLAPAGARRLVGAGRGFSAHPALAARLGGAFAALDDGVLPQAGAIAKLAAAAFARGEGGPAETLQPVYLRDDVAVPKASP